MAMMGFVEASPARVITGEQTIRAAAARRITVLVVDDEPLIRWSIAETLVDRGIQVTTAPDGRTAIGAVVSVARRFDVILLDYELPDVSNWSLLTSLREAVPESAIVLMTAFCTRELATEAVDLGARCVLCKPFDLTGLAELTRALAQTNPG
jgi:DNA-binding response OmpR family regulator